MIEILKRGITETPLTLLSSETEIFLRLDSGQVCCDSETSEFIHRSDCQREREIKKLCSVSPVEASTRLISL